MYSAIQIPELRDELVQSLAGGACHEFWALVLMGSTTGKEGGFLFSVPHSQGEPEDLERLAGHELERQYLGTRVADEKVLHKYSMLMARMLRVSEMYYVNSKMTDLAQASGKTLPQFSLTRDTLPAEVGFLLFDHDLEMGSDAFDNERGIIGVSWFPDIDSLWVQMWERSSWWKQDGSGIGEILERMGRLMPVTPNGTYGTPENPEVLNGVIRIPFKLINGEDDWDYWGEYADIVRTLMATWILMRQKVASTKLVEWNHKALKQFKRREMPPAIVRTVSLRHMSNPVEYESEREDGGRVYNHRWWVQGHWRQQPYASTGEVRAIWIAPHVKGPEGAEFLTGEKVNVLRR